MTQAEATLEPPARPRDGGPWARWPVAMASAVTFAALMLAAAANILDPIVRHDDFGALFADPTAFYAKTLEEGRWLNYWWHLRGFTTPAWLNFAVYQLCWAIFAGASAVNACGRGARPFYLVTLALLIAVAPQALIISLWFNTLIPGMALVALYAVLACHLRPAATRMLLVVFVPLTLMAYTTYPVMLLGICLTQQGARRGAVDLFALCALFIGSFVLAMLAIYALNHAEHGVFGMQMAAWRDPSPAHDLASALANLDKVAAFMHDSALVAAYYFKPLAWANVAALVLGLVYLGRIDAWAAIYILTGILAGLSMISLHVLKEGVWVPVRATGFVWVLYAVTLLRCAQLAEGRHRRIARLVRNFALLLVLSYLLQTAKHFVGYAGWQRITADMAAVVAGETGPIYVAGSYKALPEAQVAGIQFPRGLRLRLTHLTGRKVILCDETPEACAALPEGLAEASGRPPFETRPLAGGSLILLPPLASGPGAGAGAAGG